MTDPRELEAIDARWCDAEDALALGEVPEHAYLPEDPRWSEAWGRERAFYAALAREASGGVAHAGGVANADADRLAYGSPGITPGTATGTMPTADDLALVDAVLARHALDHGHAHPAVGGGTIVAEAPANDDARRASTTQWVTVVLALAAAVVLAFFVLTPELGLRASNGSWVAEGGQRHGTGDELPMAVWLVADGPACAELDEAAFGTEGDDAGGSPRKPSVCAGEGTVLRLHADDDGRTRVEVRDGSVTIEGALAVETAAGALRGDDASRFAVMVSEDDGTVDVDVQQGALQLAAPEGDRTLEAGRRLRLGDDAATPEQPVPPQPEAASPIVPEPSSPEAASPAVQEPASPEPSPSGTRSSERAAKPTVGPGELLVQARARLGEGDERGAAKAYAALIEAHGGSAEAQAARISLGQLRLAGGRPKAALALFDRYLQRGGPLAEEALWGRIQALAALGRGAELAAAVDRLVRELPRSVYRSRAQALLSKRAGSRR